MFLIIFCVVSPKKYINFVCIFFLQTSSSLLLSSSSGRPLLSCWWGCKIYIYIFICIKGASCFFRISFLVFLIDLKNLSNFRKHISGSMEHTVGEHGKLSMTYQTSYWILPWFKFVDSFLLFSDYFSAPLRKISPGTFAPMPFDASIVYEYIFCSYIFCTKYNKKNFTYITYRTYFFYCSLVVCISENTNTINCQLYKFSSLCRHMVSWCVCVCVEEKCKAHPH